jgi:methyl coenzyme M reductase gamma subunit
MSKKNTEFIINKKRHKEEQQAKKSAKDGVYAYGFGHDYDYLDEGRYPIVEATLEELKDETDSLGGYVHAYTATQNGRTKYFIKFSNGRLYDPTDIYNSNRALYRNVSGQIKWSYREVNKNVFKYYIEFLKTKNPAWISNAMRMV